MKDLSKRKLGSEIKDDRKVLVVYASEFGTTAEVAEIIGETLRNQGNSDETKWVKNVKD